MKYAAAGREVHECERDESATGVIFRVEEGWNIQIEAYGDMESIKYCPYCGTKLD